jgi:tetratricopeptide (TPR) repeat protein
LTLKHDGLLADSETELRKLLASDARDSEVLFQLGRLHLAMNRYPEAEGVFRRLIDESPKYAPAHFMLGFVSYRQDDPEKALASFRKLLELEPDHAEGRYYLGMSLQKLGDREGARKAFEQVLGIDPEHVGSNYNLALLLAKGGELEESQRRRELFRQLTEGRDRLDTLEERVRWDPGNAKFYLALGQEYARLKRTKEALQAFQRALEIQPDLAAAEVAIANLLGNPTP